MEFLTLGNHAFNADKVLTIDQALKKSGNELKIVIELQLEGQNCKHEVTLRKGSEDQYYKFCTKAGLVPMSFGE